MEPEEPFADDQDVEISDLPDDETGKQTWEKMRGKLRSLQPRRWRLLQGVAIALLGGCLLFLLLRGTPGLNGSPFTSIFGPPPTPTAFNGPQSSLFYVDASPPWGILSIDGKRLARLPDETSGQPLQLAAGSHRLTWQAAPFSTQSCVISVPSSFTDTCTATESVQTPDRHFAWIISFRNSLDTLPQNQQNALGAQIQQALNGLQSSDSVHPGEQFVDTPLNSHAPVIPPPTMTARQTLRATLHLTWPGRFQGGTCMGGNTPNSCEMNGLDCHALCTLDNQGQDNAWHVATVVATSWTYTALNGSIVAANATDESGEEIDHLLPLTITWDGARWHVQAASQFINGPIPCVAATDQGTIGNTFGTSPFQAFSWNFVPAQNIAAGCLIVLTSLVNGGPSPTPNSQIIYLHRFGLFIAINRLAREYNSSAPGPTAYELSLARELAAQGHIAFS